MDNKVENKYKYLFEIVASTVKEKRDAKCISIKELAKLSDVSPATISDLENKKCLPKIEVLLRIFHALNIQLADLTDNKTNNEAVKKLELNIPNNEHEKDKILKLTHDCLYMLGFTSTESNEIMNYIAYRLDVKNPLKHCVR